MITVLKVGTLSIVLMAVGINCVANGGTIYTVTYLDVNASDRVSALQSSLSVRSENPNPPLYIIDSEKLYLLIQVTWKNNFQVQIKKQFWSEEKIQNMLTDKKLNLEKYFPDPNEPYGGILWIQQDEDE